MDTDNECLALTKKAISLTENIFSALSDGDSELAQIITQERQELLEAIPLQTLQQHPSHELQFALNQLLTMNEQLVKTSVDIQSTIGNELNNLRKGISVSKTYKNIDLHK